MRTAIALLSLLALYGCAHHPTGRNAARNLALLEQYYAHAKAGEYARQAAMWASAGINLGKPTDPEGIRTAIEDIHRTFPDYASVALETLNTMLSMKNVMLVETERFLQLVPCKDLPQMPLKIFRGLDQTGDVRGSEVVTVVLELKNLDSAEVAKATSSM